MGLKGRQTQKIEQNIEEKQAVKQMIKQIGRLLPKDALYVAEEYVDEEDEEFVEVDDEIDNVVDDVVVPPPDYRIEFFVIGDEVFTLSSSKEARKFADALKEYVVDKVETWADLMDMYGVLKGFTDKKTRAGQRWARSLVYFDTFDNVVPVSYFLGGSGRQGKKDVYRLVKETVEKHKEIFLENEEWIETTAQEYLEDDYIRDVFSVVADKLGISDVWQVLSSIELVNILIEVGIIRGE